MFSFRRITTKCLFAFIPSESFLQEERQQAEGQCPALPYGGLPDCHRRDAYLEAQSVRPCTGWAAGGCGINPGVLLGWVWKKGRPG